MKLFKLTLVLTYRCNMKCAYCYVHLATQDRLPRAHAVQAIDLALGKLPPDGVLDLGFFGGEPLLELDEVVALSGLAREKAAARGGRAVVSLTTNGTLLTSDAVAKLKEAEVFLTVSFDGVAAAHDANRPFVSGGGTHASVLEGIARCHAGGLPVAVNMVVDPSNVARLAAGYQLALDRGVDRVVISINYDADWREPALEVLGEQYGLVGERYVRAIKAGRPATVSWLEEKLERAVHGPGETCTFGRSEIAVDPRGRIFPCTRLVRDRGGDEHVIGQLPGGFAAPAKGPLPDDCQACALVSSCSNACACVNLSRTGKVNEPDGLVCFLENLTNRVARRVATALLGGPA